MFGSTLQKENAVPVTFSSASVMQNSTILLRDLSE